MAQRSHDGIESSADAILDGFTDAFDDMLRLRPEPDAFEARGRAVMGSIIRPHVEAGAPIPLVLPGLAHANVNPEKTFGPLPDRAEQAALEHLDAFCARIAALYGPGARITIISDSRVWADLTGADASDAIAYGIALRQMASPLASVDLIGLDALLDGDPIAALDAEFGARAQRLVDGLLQSAQADAVVGRLARLIAEDDMPATPRDVMARHVMIGALTDARFPGHLRLSVHGRDCSGPKFGCRFGSTPPPRGQTPILPNHGVAVQRLDGTFEVMHLRDARALPATLRTTADGRPWYFERTQP